jgi:hypothetical protein
VKTLFYLLFITLVTRLALLARARDLCGVARRMADRMTCTNQNTCCMTA